MLDPIAAFRELNRAGALHLPKLGGGHTSLRFRALLEFGRQNLSLARLIEAHTDAIEILSEAKRSSTPHDWYGVWASDGPQSTLVAQQSPRGKWQLSGVKQYCSGAPYVTRALVTARHNNDILLFELNLDAPGVHQQESTWKSSAFEQTQTRPVAFDNVELNSNSLIAADSWYLTRPGFWQGALAPAACWAGGACSLIDSAERLGKKDPHSLAHRGALHASRWALNAILDTAGQQIDANVEETSFSARRRALTVRHLIERHCTDVLDRFGQATGPQLLAFDECVARNHQELNVYIRQCHGDRDLAGICSEAQS